MLVSLETLAELDEVLHRPKFSRYFSLRDARSILDRLASEALLIAVPAKRHRSRDPTDDVFLDLAVAGGADWLVTGDGDLLMLGAVGKARIVTPAVFVAALAG